MSGGPPSALLASLGQKGRREGAAEECAEGAGATPGTRRAASGGTCRISHAPEGQTTESEVSGLMLMRETCLEARSGGSGPTPEFEDEILGIFEKETTSSWREAARVHII